MAFSVQAYKLLEYAQMSARAHGAHGIYTGNLLKGLVYLLRGDIPYNVERAALPVQYVSRDLHLDENLDVMYPLRYSEAAINALKRAGKEAMADKCPLQPYHVLLGMTLVDGKARRLLLLKGLNAEKLRKQVIHLEKDAHLSENILKQIKEFDVARIDHEAKFIDEPLSPYEKVMWVDPGIYPLVCALNRIQGVRTTSSCEGHRSDSPASVDFECPMNFILPLTQIVQHYRELIVRIKAAERLEAFRCSIQIHYEGVKEALYRTQREMIKQFEDLDLLTEQSRVAFIPLENWLGGDTSKNQHRRELIGRKRELKCSFCGRGKDEIQKLVSSGQEAWIFICDKCILDCVKILGEEHLPLFEDMLEIVKKSKES